MKFREYYTVKYQFVSGWGINRGEIGGLPCERAFEKLDEALHFVNQFSCHECANPYSQNTKQICRKSNDIDEAALYHLRAPEIWHMNLRGDWRSFQEHEQFLGKKPNASLWKHIDGDVYCIKVEFFNLKTRLVECSSFYYKTLQDAFKNLKFKDNKTRLLSDWTLYSTHLVKP